MFLDEHKKWNLLHSIIIPLRCVPVSAVVKLILTFLGGLTDPLRVMATAYFIDSALGVVRGGNDVSTTVLPILAVLGIVTWGIFQGGIQALVGIRFTSALRRRLRLEFMEKRARLQYHYLENNDICDLIDRVAKAPEQQYEEMFATSSSVIGMTLSIGGFLAILYSASWWVCLVIGQIGRAHV